MLIWNEKDNCHDIRIDVGLVEKFEITPEVFGTTIDIVVHPK